jgi:hypothetical protein
LLPAWGVISADQSEGKLLEGGGGEGGSRSGETDLETDLPDISAIITVTRASAMTLHVQAARVGGLSASYYDYFASFLPADAGRASSVTRQDAGVDFSDGSTAADAAWPPAAAIFGNASEDASSACGSFAVKWRGFLKPHFFQQYTFRTTIHDYLGTSHHERVALWINSVEVIAQWSSLSHAQPSGTFSFRPQPAAAAAGSSIWYLLEMQYKDCEAGARRVKLEWETDEYARVVELSAVDMQRLYYPLPLASSPYQLQVFPAAVHAASSWVFGNVC